MIQRLARFQVLACRAICLVTCLVGANGAYGVDLLSEDFEGLTLQQMVTFETEVRSREAWTPDVPTGAGVEGTWEIDNSLFNATSLGDDLDGVTEFEGWTFVDKLWWINTAGDQDRTQYVSASGTIMVADPDEWDDFGEADNNGSAADPAFKSSLFIRDIPLQGIGANTAKLSFHSSWRPEDTQAARLTISYSEGTTFDLLKWDSDEDGPSPNFHPDATNETINLELFNPAGATTATLEFYLEGQNDWWWAIDNLSMFTGENPLQDGALRLTIDRDTRQVKIKNNTGATVPLRGYSIESAFGTLDESAATYKGDGDSNWQILDNPTGSELSEGYLLPSFAFAATAEIDLGTSWRKYSQDVNDISFVYSVAGEDEPRVGIIEFTGNGGNTFDFLDLTFDGAVDLADYQEFLNGYGTPLAGLTQAQRNVLSDLNNDSVHSVLDFLEFKRQFEQLQGAGAFAAMLASVPEPGSMLMLLTACGMGLVMRSGRRRAAWPLLGALAIVVLSTTGRVQAQQVLYLEDFESVPLTTSPEEDPNAGNVWNETGPAGWTIDDSGMPPNTSPDPLDAACVNPGDCDGVTDWNGWAFVDKDWWIEASGDQGRIAFTRGVGTAMVADPDEWDDAANLPSSRVAPYDYFDAFATTQVINIPAGIPANKVYLAFDSSWRPEGPDELEDSNNQRAQIWVSYGGGAEQEVLNWESDQSGPNAKGAAENEGVELDGATMGHDGVATTMQLKFGMTRAVNDWWWAIDNLRVFIPAEPSVLTIHQDTGMAEITGGDVITATINTLDIVSAGGTLAPVGDVGLFFNASDNDSLGAGIDNNWSLATASANQFSEFFLDGSSTFTESRTESLGQIYDPTTPEVDQDLVFTYTTIFGDVIEGDVEYVGTPVVGVDNADFDSDGDVDGTDFLTWQRGAGSAGGLAMGDANGNGFVDGDDLAILEVQFGQTSALAATVAVPEPAGVELAALLLVALGLLRLQPGRFHKSLAVGGLVLLALFSGFLPRAAHAVIPPPTLDRDYRFGDDTTGENAVAGAIVGSLDVLGENRTRDSIGQLNTNQLIDLKAKGSGGFPLPKYETITDRPDGVSGTLGIRLNQLSFDRQYLQTGRDEALNFPELSASSTESITTPPGIIDYKFITDRGFEIWVKPGDRTGRPVEDQHIVMDTNNHGVMINAAGKFSMRYSYSSSPTAPEEANTVDFEGVTSPAVDNWYHLMVVRPFGPGRTGSVLYVDGVAEAAVNGKYIGEDVPNDEAFEDIIVHDRLVIGANTTTDGGGDGTDNYFSGVVDDLKMFLMGLNNAGDYGEFEIERDNSYISFFKPTTDGDLTGDNDVTPADVTIFADNWLFEKRLSGLLVGDLESRDVGDFNYDGRVDLGDWNILNDANPAMAALAMSMIQSVPEPATLALVALLLVGAVSLRTRWDSRPC